MSSKPSLTWRKVGGALLVIAVLVGGCCIRVACLSPRYPYGWSHCCDKMLMNALYQYADLHDGWFPRGQATAEASLSLLFREQLLDANVLRGKTVPEEVVAARLNAGDLLTPETCGWHYVEGLRRGDDRRLALFWDKAGLGHNGEELYGYRDVCRLSGVDRIAAAEWPAFLAEQEQLLITIRDRNRRLAEPSDGAESR